MWEQILVRIAIQLIYKRLREKGLLKSDQILQSAVAQQSVTTIKDLENMLKSDSDIEYEAVAIVTELVDGILKTGIDNILKLLIKRS